MDEAALLARIEELERKLHESEQIARALAAGEIDTVADGEGSTHVLLHAAQEKLHASEQFLRAIFDGAMDAMLIADDSGAYVDANPAACALFGLSRKELIGRSIGEFAAPGFVTASSWQAFLAAGQARGEFPLLRLDGQRRELDFSAVANVLPGAHLSVLRDVTERKRTGEALRDAENRLHMVIANAPLILFALDRDGVYTLHEGKALAAIGLRPGQLVGQSVFARPGRTDAEFEMLRRALAGEEIRGSFKMGETEFDSTLVPLRDDTGALAGVSGVAFDVTERNKAEAALRASEGRFRAMIEKSRDGISLLGAEGETLYQSPAAERLLGYSLEEARRMSWRDFVPAGEWPKLAGALGKLQGAPSATVSIDFQIKHRLGHLLWLELTATNLLHDPDIGALVTNFRDITERKAAEEALRESRRLLEDAQAVAHLGSWASGAQADLPITWSEECARIFGREAGPPPTVEAFFAMVHPDDRAAIIEASRRALAEGVACETEHRIVRPDGEQRWVHARAVIEGAVDWPGDVIRVGPSASGRPYRVVGVIQDVTERRRMQEEVQASEARYRRIVESTSDGVWMYDAAGLTTFMNARMAEMLGYTVAEAIGKPVFSFVHEAMHGDAARRMELRRSGEMGRHEIRLKGRDGSDFWAAVRATPLVDRSGNFEQALALVTDVTETRAAVQAKNRLAAIVESSLDAIISESLDGIVQSWNKGAERLFQWSATEMIGQPFSIILPPDGVEGHLALVERIRTGESVAHFEAKRVRKDGSLVEVSLTASPLRDAEGTVVGLSKILRDLTESKSAERKLRQTEEQLLQAQKMESIGVLAGGVAHDFNNMLSVILTFTGLLLKELKPGDPMRDDLEQVHRAGERAAELTRQLLAFSRRQVLQPQVVDVGQIVTWAEKMLRRLIGEDIELSLLASRATGLVFADPSQLEQVVMNLVVNARDAMPSGGKLSLETADVVLDEAYAAEHPAVTPGPYVMLAVTDTGIGMDKATAERIFEPFFTTKEKGKGTGLGLSTVFGIVRQSNGHIWVYSEPGHGTTFKLYFPRTDRPADEVVIPAEPATLRGSETILLVEDDDQVRRSSLAILRRNGYDVIEARNGGEALLICEKLPGRIDLLLTDVVMPRMSGRELADRLAPLRPEMRVLFVSGYTDEAVVHHGVLGAGTSFLQKPITPDALLRKLREVLAAPPSA